MKWIDWLLLTLFFVVIIYVNFRLKKRGSTDLTSFFLGGRKLPWYIAGTSMVATTFAADTPLWVAEKVSQFGISGNWIWWNMLIGGMLTVFFFAKLWRRAGVLTELEFIELRYSGKTAAFLRGFRALYLGVFLNAIIIGWVNFALAKILQVFFDIPAGEVVWWIMGAMLFVGIYSSISGLIGVAITDAIQFVLAMVGCVLLAVYALDHPSVGGISGLKQQLPEWRFHIFPRIESWSDLKEAGIYSITPLAFISFAAVQWWASWYPGAEPGGGGYVAQRMMSAKNEKHAVWATLFFQVAHYCLRPWPWIITGLALLLIYPGGTPADASTNFVLAMRDLMPPGVKGLLLAAFFGAYMSTISTQLNWSASFITHDFLLRFFYKTKHLSDTKKVWLGRYSNLALMVIGAIVSTQINMLDDAARFLIECGAGLGLVLILRWYWWRINAWSEISATIFPIIFYIVFHQIYPLPQPLDFICTVFASSAGWILVTFFTQPEPLEHLQAFCERVRPKGFWKGMAGSTKNNYFTYLIPTWLTSIVFTYSFLIGMGKWILQEWHEAWFYTGITTILGVILIKLIPKALQEDE